MSVETPPSLPALSASSPPSKLLASAGALEKSLDFPPDDYRDLPGARLLPFARLLRNPIILGMVLVFIGPVVSLAGLFVALTGVFGPIAKAVDSATSMLKKGNTHD